MCFQDRQRPPGSRPPGPGDGRTAAAPADVASCGAACCAGRRWRATARTPDCRDWDVPMWDLAEPRRRSGVVGAGRRGGAVGCRLSARRSHRGGELGKPVGWGGQPSGRDARCLARPESQTESRRVRSRARADGETGEMSNGPNFHGLHCCAEY